MKAKFFLCTVCDASLKLFCVLFILVAPAAAQTSTQTTSTATPLCSIICPRKAVTERAIQSGIQTQVQNSISPRYTNPKVRVNLSKIKASDQVVTIALSGLLSGLNVQDSDHPRGLSFGVSGNSAVAVSGVCEYTYLVRISTRATDSHTGERLSTQTESYINVDTPLSGKTVCRKP